MQRLVLPRPRGTHRLCAGVGRVKPIVPLTPQLRRVGLRQPVERAIKMVTRQTVLIADLDHRHARLGGVGVAGIGVDVGQQLAGILLLQLDHAGLELPHRLVCPRQVLRVGKPVALIERPPHVKVHVHVDAALLESGDHIIQLLKLRGIEIPLGLRVVGQDRLRGLRHEVHVPRIHEMQAHTIDAEAGQPRRQLVRVLVFREIGRPRQIRRMEPDRPHVRDEIPVLDSDEAVLAGRRIEQMRHAGGVVRAIVGDHEREHGRELRRRATRGHQPDHPQPANQQFHFFSACSAMPHADNPEKN